MKMLQPYDMSLHELKKYKPDLTKQQDFAVFWQGTLNLLDEVPLKYELKPYDYPAIGVKVYEVSFYGYNRANITGWLAIPTSLGPHPGIAFFPGYNWSSDGDLHDTVIWAHRGYACLHMLVRGQAGSSVDNIIVSHGFYAGWLTKGILSKEEYYYRSVYMDAVRAVQILAALENVDENRIGVTGMSQGGALSLAVSALSHIPKVVLAEVPAFCNLERFIEISPGGPSHEFNEFMRRNTGPGIEEKVKNTMSYFDIINFASEIRCHVFLTAGLIDDSVPPSTIFAAYNHLECSKQIHTSRYFGHEYIPSAIEPKLRVLMKYLM